MAEKRQPLSNRSPVTQREVHRYRPGRETVATPVDRVSRETSAGKKLQQLGEALSQGTETAGQFGRFRQQEQAYQEEEGMRLAAAGEELPEDSPDAKVRGFMKAKGEADVAEFEREITDYFNRNWNKDPEEFKEGLDSHMDEFVHGQSTDYLETFLPNARKVEHKVLSKWQEANHEQVMNEGIYNTVQGFEHRVESIFEETQADTSEMSEDEIEKLQKKRAGRIRQELSKAQERAKEFGAHRDDVSKRALVSMGQMAVQYANPDLLDFVDEPDESGIKLSTKYPEDAMKWKQKAVEARDTLVENADERAKEQRKNTSQAMNKKMTVEIDNITRQYDNIETEEAQRELLGLREKLIQEYSPHLDESDLRRNLENIGDLLDLQGFARQSDPNIFQQLSYEAQMISSMDEFHDPDNEDFLDKLMSARGNLSRKDYRQIMSQARNEIDNVEDERATSVKNYAKRLKSRLEERLKTQGEGMITTALDKGPQQKQDDKRLEYMEERWMDKYMALIDKTDGRPTKEQIDKMRDEVYNEALKEIPTPSLIETQGQSSRSQSSDRDPRENQGGSFGGSRSEAFDKLTE